MSYQSGGASGRHEGYGQSDQGAGYSQGYDQQGYGASGQQYPGYGQPGQGQAPQGQPAGYQQGYGQPGYGQGYGQQTPSYPGFGQPGQQGYGQPGYGQQGYDQQGYGQFGQGQGQYGYGAPAPQKAPSQGLPANIGQILAITIGALGVLTLLFGFAPAGGDGYLTGNVLETTFNIGYVVTVVAGLLALTTLLPKLDAKVSQIVAALAVTGTLVSIFVFATASFDIRWGGVLLLVFSLLASIAAVLWLLVDGGLVKVAPAPGAETDATGSAAASTPDTSAEVPSATQPSTTGPAASAPTYGTTSGYTPSSPSTPAGSSYGQSSSAPSTPGSGTPSDPNSAPGASSSGYGVTYGSSDQSTTVFKADPSASKEPPAGSGS